MEGSLKSADDQRSTAETTLHPVTTVKAGPRASTFLGWRGLLLSVGAYTALSLVVWSNVWLSHPSSTTTCGCGDASMFTWFLEWPAYAISHGLSPLHSTAMGYPGGVNLLASTSNLAIGIVLAPVTWLFGPVTTLNVALTISPVLSALAMFVLLRRWVSWMPAAFFGGLFYGFSPFILGNLSNAWLLLGMAALPPLIVVGLDELLIRQRRHPALVGVALAVLVALQFFLSTEMLLIVAICSVGGVLVLIAYAAVHEPSVLARRARYAITGLVTAGVVGVLLLAYPAWFALDGPGHISGPVWHGFPFSQWNASLSSYVVPTPSASFAVSIRHAIGGYQGPFLSLQYFGWGIVAVLVAGTITWRHDRRLWFFGLIAAVTVVLSLGARDTVSLPWLLVLHRPLFQNIWPSRFALIGYLAAAVMLGLVIEHAYVAVQARRNTRLQNDEGQVGWRWPKWIGAAFGCLVAAIAIVPVGAYLAQGIPITVQPVDVPTWFQTAAPRLSGHQVLLVFPAPFTAIESSMTWQAVGGIHYSMVGEGGPTGLISRMPTIDQRGAAVIDEVTYPIYETPPITSADIAAVRQALHGWKVTTVVIPDQPGLPSYDQPHSVTLAAALVSAATGMKPTFQAHAWVWTHVDKVRSWAGPDTGRFNTCLTGLATRGAPAVHQATACVLTPSVGAATLGSG
jgi:hypothetical protein